MLLEKPYTLKLRVEKQNGDRSLALECGGEAVQELGLKSQPAGS